MKWGTYVPLVDLLDMAISELLKKYIIGLEQKKVWF